MMVGILLFVGAVALLFVGGALIIKVGRKYYQWHLAPARWQVASILPFALAPGVLLFIWERDLLWFCLLISMASFVWALPFCRWLANIVGLNSFRKNTADAGGDIVGMLTAREVRLRA